MAKRNLIALMTVLSGLIGSAGPTLSDDLFDARWYGLSGACDQRCSAMVFGGKFVTTAMSDIFLGGDLSPFNWHYGDSEFLGFAASRTVASLFDDAVLIQPEFGFGKRFGAMDEWEVWGGVFFRYQNFPWNDYIFTTVAASTGLNYASGISDIEKARSGNGRGARLLHYLAPEITFALPQHKSTELVIRFHHRSGGYGVVSDADGGAQYLTMGLRFHF